MSNIREDPTIYPGLRIYNGTNYDTVVERVEYGGVSVIAIGPNRMANGEMVAYKTLRNEFMADSGVRASFIHECLLWGGLWPHPNIAVAYEAFEMEQRVFLALAYAEYGSLRTLLRRGLRNQPGGRLPVEHALLMAQQIASGLAYLHSPDPAFLRNAPIVHRDLKPENVLLLADGRIVITDFGLAKVVEKSATALALVLSEDTEARTLEPQLAEEAILLTDEGATQTTSVRTANGVAVGTPPYMSPEQWEDPRHVGPPADIYALGIMLSEIFTRRHALLDLDQPHLQADWQHAHLNLLPRSLREVAPDVPDSVEAIYQHCLGRDPENRPTADEVLMALQAGARAVGQDAYEAPEIAAHTPYNAFVQWYVWSNAYFSFDLTHEALIRNDRALAFARLLSDERPDLLPDTLMVRGNILRKMGALAHETEDEVEAARWDQQAEQAYAESLAAYPPGSSTEGRQGRWSVWRQIGVFNSERKRYAYAEDAYARALAFRPDDGITFFNRAMSQAQWGMAEVNAGRRESGIEHLRHARVFAVTAHSLGDPTAQRLIESIEAALRQYGAAD